MFEIRGAQIEVPAIVAVAGFKAYCGWRAGERHVVVAPLLEVTVDRGLLEYVWLGFDKATRGLQAVVLQDLNRPHCRYMPPLPVAAPELKGCDELAVELQLLSRQLARCAVIRSLQSAQPALRAQSPVKCNFRDAVELCGLLKNGPAFMGARGRDLQPPAQVYQCFWGNAFASHLRH